MSMCSISQAPESKARQFHSARNTLASRRSNATDSPPIRVNPPLNAESPSHRKGSKLASNFKA